MLSHDYPWTDVADGGNFGGIYRAPLAERPRASVGGRSGMFLSTYVNKVDRKGRVSVPATFRTSLAAQRFPGIVAFRHTNIRRSRQQHRANGGAGRPASRCSRKFSDEHENLAHCCLPRLSELPFDTEGRVVLPADLAQHAFITDSAAFVGLGKSFQIWEPGRFAEHLANLRERARRQGTRIPPLGGMPDRRRE